MSDHRPRILFTSPILGYPAIGGPELRILNSIRALSQVSELHIVSRRSMESIGGAASAKYLEDTCEHLAFAASVSDRNLSQKVQRRLAKISRLTPVDTELEDFEFIAKYAKLIRTDIIWLGYGCISYPLLRYLKEQFDIPIVVDTDSVWSEFILRGIPFAKTAEQAAKIEAEGRAKREEETWGTGVADVTTAVSEIDAEFYRQWVPDHNRIRVFGNVIDLNDYHENSLRRDEVANDSNPPPSLYLAGSFAPDSPMTDAANWMIEEIMPLIRQAVPNALLRVVGQGSLETLRDVDPQIVQVVGRVESVLPYIDQSDVIVVPLRYESGTRFKILEAGACKKAVVSTTLGAEGIPVTHAKDILLGDSPAEFAHATVQLLQDAPLRKRMGSELRKLVEANFTVDSLVDQANEICRFLLDGQYRHHGGPDEQR